MFNFRHIVLSMFVLSSSTVLAGAMGKTCSAADVTVPCSSCPVWDFGIRALYLKPTTDIGQASQLFIQGNNRLQQGVQPDWGWGFQLEASRHFGSGQDLTADWAHFNAGSNSIFSPGLPITINDSGVVRTFTNVEAANNPIWDQVNIALGQQVDFGENKFIRLHGGFNYSRVGDNGYRSSQIAATDSILTVRYLSSVFNGFGPRIGIDLNFESNSRWMIYGKGAMSILAGTHKSSYQMVEFDPNSTTDVSDNSYTINKGNPNFVPELDAKFGAMYSYMTKHGALSFDAGWLWSYYAGVLSAINDAGASSPLYYPSMPRDWGIQGFYIGMKYIGNIT